MTILPKKKHQSSKNDDGSHHADAERGHQRGEEGRLNVPGPSCSWHQDPHPVDGPSHVKRRHRDGHTRAPRQEDSAQSGSSAASAASSGGSSPIAGPSGFKPKKSSKLKRGKEVPKQVRSEEQPDALNSDDEYERMRDEALTEQEWAFREENFEELMKEKNWTIKQMEQDGACLFRAVADQVYGDQEMHGVVRGHCMDYIEKNADFFSQYITEEFDAYVSRKRLDYVHGNHVEIQAMSEMYNRPIEVYSYNAEPLSTFTSEQPTDNPPIRLSYHRHVHYNSLVDPWAPTIGVGLGLPGYKPGLADKKLVNDALQQSEASALEQAMLEDKLKATDWEATDEAIEAQVARESYLQWLKDSQKRRDSSSPQTSSSASSSSSSSPPLPSLKAGRSPGGRHGAHGGFPSPKPSTSYSHLSSPASRSPTMSSAGATGGPSTSKRKTREDRLGFEVDETASFLNNLPPEVFGLNDFDDHDTVLAQVLAASQEEYLNSLKKTKPDEDCGEPETMSGEKYDGPSGAVGDVRDDTLRTL